MHTQDIRRYFLDFFKQQDHSIVPSSPVLPHDDPTLLFNNAGMNQFKDVFLGTSVRNYKRAASSQKCIRVGGKHNDLDNVGHTHRHLTFFEMLGNFSFGDYFKAEAIRFAWEVSVEVFKLDAERIWATVFREDDEAYEMWKAYLPEQRIVRFDEKDNFWAMGETGPCGPCSELLYDRGAAYGEATDPHADESGERYLEFWNLVFMQFNRDDSGKMTPLPKPCIDTGAGLERIVGLKMDVESVYQTDVLRSLIEQIQEVSGVVYSPEDRQKAPAFHVIADHLRSLSFAIADGVQPSNVDRGYVLRKILRRAVRYGRTLGLQEPFLAQVYPRLVKEMGESYPELKTAEERVREILTVEEEAFLRTLKRGGSILNQIIVRSQEHHGCIRGEDAFKLKDTYGFPLEEVQLIAKDAGLKVELERFEKLEEEARERSRSVHASTKQMAQENIFEEHLENFGACEFLGYSDLKATGKVTALLLPDHRFVQELREGQEGLVLTDRTPFYGEMGGQAGDTGRLVKEGGLFEVHDCQTPFPGIVAHKGCLKQGTLRLGDRLDLEVHEERRQRIAKHHTATHLLHWALCTVLGDHVRQAGSVVDAQRLRFDFSHHKALTAEELHRIEDLVNEKIRKNTLVQSYELPYEQVQKRQDIKQFFGEKYGEWVRVVDIEDSKELCGGTHTSQVGRIGYFRIVKESSIAAGVRRIEGVSGEAAEAFTRDQEQEREALATLLKVHPNKLHDRIAKLLEENAALERELKAAKEGKIKELLASLKDQVELVRETPLLTAEIALEPEDLRTLANRLVQSVPSCVLVLGTAVGGKGFLLAKVSKDLQGKGWKAHEIIRQIAPLIGGGGGGKADAAQAGGKNAERLGEALQKTREIVEAQC